ncbi:glycosyltransferase family 4 protein [Candidatus Daviesbacteria bacterium]|nr:glycosyltransferase family 4 protein [Candidatus Daviesbacteria bacterium]
MIIGFDASRAFIKEKTGTENYSYQLLKALARIDRKNTYQVYLRPGVNFVKKDFPDNFQFSTLNFKFLWTQGGLALQTFKDNIDVLFVPAHTLPVIRKPGLKTLVTVHDLGSEYLPAMHQLKQRLYLNFMTRSQLKSATALIAVSRATKDDLIKRVGIKPDKISVSYEGYDKEKFKDTQSIKKYNLKYHSYFLFVGTVQPRKNLERLIIAFSKFISEEKLIYEQDLRFKNTDLRIKNHKSLIINHKSLKLVIAGSKGWLSDEIYQLPKKLGIEDRVKFLGYVPDKDLSALYFGAIALLFPSLFEGFGLPILEAQACGCPVITSNLSSMPEVAGKGAVYVNPYSVDDIVKGMIRIKNQELRIKLIKAGLDNIERFSWEKCAKETLGVLENL